MRNSQFKLLIAAIVLTGVYLLALGFNLSPGLRGPDEWRWAYVIPGSFSRLWLPALVLGGYSTFIIWWRFQPETKHRTAVTLTAAAIMTAAIQLSLLYLEHQDIKSQLFYRTVSASSGGFFNVGAVVTDTADFLANFVEKMAEFPVHPQRHPPGIPLLFAWTRQFLDKQPAMASTFSDILRPYQCHNLSLMNLPNSAIGSALVQMLVPFGLALAVWPLYEFGRRAYDSATALRAVLIWPIIPSVALWATRWNHTYALFTLAAFLLIHVGLTRRRLWLFLPLGLVISISLIFSFGNAVIAGLLIIYAILWLLTAEERPAFGWLASAAILAALGLVSLWIILWLAYSLNPTELWTAAVGIHLGLSRSYLTWLFYHPYDFFVFFGIPLFVFWLASLVTVVRNWRRGQVDILAATFFIGLFLLIISGTSRGEVARVWAFLLPLVLLATVHYVPKEGITFGTLAVLLAIQLFVSNIFLRPVGTGLSDPPSAPREVDVKEADVLASWEDGPLLQAAQLPSSIDPGQPIRISATWSTSEQIDKPYTIFVHLVNKQGQLVAQQDGMPMSDQWLTTCWRKGSSFVDGYEIDTPADLAPGTYDLRLGFYWLTTGERLPIQDSPSDSPDSFLLGRIRIAEGTAEDSAGYDPIIMGTAWGAG